MGLLTRLKAAALFGCLLFTSQSFAEAYYWTLGMDQTTRFSTALSACPGDIGTIYGYPSAFEQLESHGGVPYCMYRYYPAPEPLYKGPWVVRRGDTCPANTGPYNEDTFECPAVLVEQKPGEKCDDQTGATTQNPFIWDAQVNKCVKYFDAGQEASCKYLGATDAGPQALSVAGFIDSTGNAVAPPTFASNVMSCQVKTISTSDCVVKVGGAITCNVIAAFTGETNNGGKKVSEVTCVDGNCPIKEPQVETKKQGCTPVGTGGGGSSCTQTKETSSDGSQQCGTVNGAYQCITKKPFSNGITTNITATSENLPDGSVKVTTVKDSSNTVCTDVKTCTVKTSTTTTHSTTKPNGTTTTDTSCKGTCTPNGGGLETNPAAGSGNTGNGTGGGGTGGNGDGEGEGGDGNASTTDSCLAAPPCDGDPFQCAILQQAHIDTCKLMAPLTAEQQAAADAKVNAAYASLDAHQSALDQQANTLLGQFQSSTAGSGTGGGKCLPDFQFSVMGMSESMEFSKVCDSISWVRLMVLAGAYLFAARIVSREV